MLGKKKLSFFFIAFLFLLVIGNYLFNENIDAFLKKINISTLSVLQKKLNSFWELINDFEEFSIDKVENEIAYLKRENFLLKNQINNLKAYEKENEELKELLTLKTNVKQVYVFSKIISYDPQNQFLSLVIDKGEESGIKKGLPVIGFYKEKRFLVGFILTVGKETSLIQTLFDKKTQVAVKIGDDEVKGILRGKNYFQELLIAEFVDIDANGLVNQEVFTSGLGEKYPADVLVGKSVKAIKKNYGLFQEVEVLPYANFFKMKYVLILK